MLLTALPTPADAQSTGSVRFRVASAGFIIGTGGGTGTLNFKGRTYPLSVGGLSAGTIGVSSADRWRRVDAHREGHCRQYPVAGAGLTVVGGVSAVTLQNSNGVVLRLRGRQAGLKATLGVGGVQVTMQ